MKHRGAHLAKFMVTFSVESSGAGCVPMRALVTHFHINDNERRYGWTNGMMGPMHG